MPFLFISLLLTASFPANILHYLMFECKDLTVRVKVPLDLFLWCHWQGIGNQDRSSGWGPAEFSS